MLLNVVHYNNKSFVPTSPGVARDFFLLLLFISFILLIQFNFVTYTSLKDARTRRLPESTRVHYQVRSGPGPPTSNEAAVRLCNPCVLRTRTTSHDLDGRSKKTQACSRQVSKKFKKSKQIEKNERKAFWTLAVTSQCRIKPPPRPLHCYPRIRREPYAPVLPPRVSDVPTPTTRLCTRPRFDLIIIHSTPSRRTRQDPRRVGLGGGRARRSWPQCGLGKSACIPHWQ